MLVSSKTMARYPPSCVPSASYKSARQLGRAIFVFQQATLFGSCSNGDKTKPIKLPDASKAAATIGWMMSLLCLGQGDVGDKKSIEKNS